MLLFPITVRRGKPVEVHLLLLRLLQAMPLGLVRLKAVQFLVLVFLTPVIFWMEKRAWLVVSLYLRTQQVASFQI